MVCTTDSADPIRNERDIFSYCYLDSRRNRENKAINKTKFRLVRGYTKTDRRTRPSIGFLYSAIASL